MAVNKLIEQLKHKAECEDMGRPADHRTVTRRAIKALEAADRMAEAVDKTKEAGGAGWISPRLALARSKYRQATGAAS